MGTGPALLPLPKLVQNVHMSGSGGRGTEGHKRSWTEFSKSCPGLSAPFSQYLQVISSLVWCHKGGYVWAFSLFSKLQGTNYFSSLRNNSFFQCLRYEGLEHWISPISKFNVPPLKYWAAAWNAEVGGKLVESQSQLSLSLSLSRAADALHTNLHPRRPQ